MLLSVTVKCFLYIDQMGILSSLLSGVLFLPALLSPTQQSCMISLPTRVRTIETCQLISQNLLTLPQPSLLEERQAGSPPVRLLDPGQLFIAKLLLLLDFAAISIPLGDLPSTR